MPYTAAASHDNYGRMSSVTTALSFEPNIVLRIRANMTRVFELHHSSVECLHTGTHTTGYEPPPEAMLAASSTFAKTLPV